MEKEQKLLFILERHFLEYDRYSNLKLRVPIAANALISGLTGYILQNSSILSSWTEKFGIVVVFFIVCASAVMIISISNNRLQTVSSEITHVLQKLRMSGKGTFDNFEHYSKYLNHSYINYKWVLWSIVLTACISSYLILNTNSTI